MYCPGLERGRDSTCLLRRRERLLPNTRPSGRPTQSKNRLSGLAILSRRVCTTVEASSMQTMNSEHANYKLDGTEATGEQQTVALTATVQVSLRHSCRVKNTPSCLECERTQTQSSESLVQNSRYKDGITKTCLLTGRYLQDIAERPCLVITT